MQTQKIPFSIDKMKDAVRYETRDGREVTQVTVFDCKHAPIVAALDGKIMTFTSGGTYHLSCKCSDDLFIIIEKPIQYPCLCWVSDFDKKPQTGDLLMMMKNKDTGSQGGSWKYSTPLTDDELAEFGLMRVEK